MRDSGKAVFLSYASQDAEAAKRICKVLQAAGVEVWFDQSELRGGDVWDATIRKQIKECTLFVPIISANTQARLEGYFRIEWKLAAQRTHAMAEEKAFLLPVVIDDTSEANAKVPGEFREVQWTRLRPAGFAGQDRLASGDSLGAFCERVRALLDRSAVNLTATNDETRGQMGRATTRSRRGFGGWRGWGVGGTLAAAAVVGLAIWRGRIPTGTEATAANSPRGQVARATPTPAAQPPLDFASAKSTKSIAVLPFADMSPNKDSEYFSDGLTEEILNALARDPALRVAARTSSFSFKGRNVPVDEIGRTLRAAHLIEGSVRRDGNKVRITVQLVNAADGYHAWSQNFEGEMNNIFALQDEIAQKVALKLGVAAPVATGAASAATTPPTKNLAAYDAYLRARELHLRPGRSGPDLFAAVRQYEAVVRLDPDFALAWAHLADAAALTLGGGYDGSTETLAKARQAAERAVQLAPNLPEAHTAQAAVCQAEGDDERAARALDTAEKLRPNNAEVALLRAWTEYLRGRWTPQFWRLAQRAVELDPRSTHTLWLMGAAATVTGHFAEAEEWLSRPEARQSGASFVFRATNRVAWDGDVKTALAQLLECPESFRNEWINRSVAQLHEMARDNEAASRAWERALLLAETDVQTSGARHGHIVSLLQIGGHHARRGDAVKAKARYAQAVNEAERLVTDFPNYPLGALTLAGAQIENGDRVQAGAALAKALAEPLPLAFSYFISTAEVLTKFGRNEEAVAELRSLHERGVGFGHLLRLEPKWDPLRADPKFQQLMREAEARANAVKPLKP